MFALAVAADAAAAAHDAAARVAAAVTGAVAARGAAHVALAGGSTPRAAYALLAPLVADWDRVHLWFGDERCVPPGDPDSNMRLVAESLLSHAPVPAGNVHRIRGEADPAEAAAEYADALRALAPAGPGGVPVLDLAFLGLGEDGHTASLFPGDPLLTDPAPCRAVVAPKPPPHRVTLSLGVLCAARERILLATGPGKAAALAAVLAGPDPALPASLLPAAGTTVVADAAAVPPR